MKVLIDEHFARIRPWFEEQGDEILTVPQGSPD
jgi:hypothetical protein